VALLAGVAGCSAHDPRLPRGPVGVAVVRGVPSPPGGWDDGVVLVRTIAADHDVVCSGSLVAPNLVLTARHCVSYLTDGLFRCNARGELVDSEAGAGTLGLHFPSSDVEVYAAMEPRDQPVARGMTTLSTLSATICSNDLAFLVLDRALDLPPLPLRLGSPARKSEAVTLVGYGTTDTSDMGAPFDFRTTSRARKEDLTIADVGPDSIATDAAVPPRAILEIGAAGCVGDSGAPLVATKTHAVLGVYSLLAGDRCDSPTVRNYFVHLPAFSELIGQAFRAAGATPIEEPKDDAGAESIDAETERSDDALGTADAWDETASDAAEEPAPLAPPPPPAPEADTSDGCSLAPSKAFGFGANLRCAGLAALAFLLRVRRATRQRRPSSGSGVRGSCGLDVRGTGAFAGDTGV